MTLFLSPLELPLWNRGKVCRVCGEDCGGHRADASRQADGRYALADQLLTTGGQTPSEMPFLEVPTFPWLRQ
jgi:hypothetical protein